MSRKPSRQALRTRRLLQEAIVALVQERDYTSLRIEDITERADVGRATFYMHYKDKDDLLATIVENFYQDIVAHLEDNDRADELIGLRNTLEHIREQPDFYRVALNHGPTAGRIRDFMVSRISERLQSLGGTSRQRMDMTAHFVAGALMGMLRWWLEHEDGSTVETVTAFIRQITIQGISGSMSP